MDSTWEANKSLSLPPGRTWEAGPIDGSGSGKAGWLLRTAVP